MSKFAKLSVQVPEPVREHFVRLEHGQKQITCTAGLIWYFNADEETQCLYRIWAQAIAEGYATVEEPPGMVKDALEKRGLRRPARGKKRGR